MKRRFFSILLCTIISLSLYPQTTSAAETYGAEDEISLLSENEPSAEQQIEDTYVSEPDTGDADADSPENILPEEEVYFEEASYAANPQARYSLKLAGEFDYNKAQEVLQRVNAVRRTDFVSPLKMDKTLTDAAMQRAAETAVRASHTRPDGTDCFTVITTLDDATYGENIAMGDKTAADTVKTWCDSSGHYSNMVKSKFVSTGIGCFYSDGAYYWVQIFSSEEVKQADSRNNIQEAIVDVSILEGDSPLSFNLDRESDGNEPLLFAGTQYQLKVRNYNGAYDETREQYREENLPLLPEQPEEYCEFTGDSFVWSSSDESVLSVEQDGCVTAHSVGDAEITAATVNGNGSASIRIKVRKNIADMQITLSEDNLYYDKTPKEPEVTIQDGKEALFEGTDYDLSYSNNVDVGEANVTVTGKGSYAGTATLHFSISKRDIANEITVRILNDDLTDYAGDDGKLRFAKENVKVLYQGKELEFGSDYNFLIISTYTDERLKECVVQPCGIYTGWKDMLSLGNGTIRGLNNARYTGKKITQELQVSTQGRDLIEGQDYTVSYENNVNVGEATVTVTGTGKGACFGSYQKTFQIYPAFISSAALQFETMTYTGKKLTQKITVKAEMNGKEATLKKGRDYTVTYQDNKSIGKATVKIQGTGNFTGSKTLNFEIVPGSTELLSASSKKARTLTIKWKKNRTQTTGYEIQYSKNKKFKGTSTKTIRVENNKTTTKTLTGLKKGATYYVRVRTYKIVKKPMYYPVEYYSSWSSAKKAKV